MSWLRKSTILMMALVVIGTTAPSFACVLPANHAKWPACCQGTDPGCAQMMGMDSSCCQFSHPNSTAEIVPPFSPEHTQHLFLAASAADSVPAAGGEASLLRAADRPVPGAPPGSSTILRI